MPNNTTTIHGIGRGNPMLYSTLSMPVPPYWLLILQPLTIMLIQRLYNRWWPWKPKQEKTWFTAVEVSFLNLVLKMEQTAILANAEEFKPDQSSNTITESLYGTTISNLKSIFQFNLVDLILSSISIAQFIWISVKHFRCMYAVGASRWLCYNVFGYNCYNYVFCGTYLCGAILMIKREHPNSEKNFVARLAEISLKICYVICMILMVYFITNTLPMLLIYGAVLFPLTVAVYLIYLLFAKIGHHFLHRQTSLSKRVYFAIFLAAGQLYFPIIAAIAYNYSQYFYFGDNFTQTITDEFRSRNTLQWLERTKVNVQTIILTILSLL